MSPRIVILREPIAAPLLAELVDEVFGDMLKFVVDVERGIVAVGGEMLVDAEAVLLEDGSEQHNLWGGNYFPANQSESCIEYTSLINIRPARDNRTTHIADPALRERVRAIVWRLIGSGAPRP